MRRVAATIVAAAAGLSLASCSSGGDTPEEFNTDSPNVVNVYSSRHYDVDKMIYDRFTKDTGIEINVVEGKADELIERVKREKSDPPADVFLTVGAESLFSLNEEGILGDSMTPEIEQAIPEHFRGDNWMGVASRARVIAYNKDTVNPEDLTTYDSLTDPKFKGKVLSRSSSSSYNQALLSSFVALNGEDEAKEWAQGVVDNFARDPKGNDRDQAKAVAAGEGDIAIMNSYYWAQMKHSSDPEEQKVTEKVGLSFPENTHLNISYASVLEGAKHADNAKSFLEYLASPEIQELIAEENGEFPMNPQAQLPEVQKSWGEFTTQKLDFATFGDERPVATRIFDEVGWK
ncbi:Iron deficiency-induced protein A precursor [Corynebacterium ciconiae DSM 44920]|uniref:extracellular solute-binding protein n=1 Tax=Corynebacterium ciconiae TaxID=227319 RepID=UPI000376A051|nr:extracellular solute-binding protein [Corynebacterium ciconiae]WKD62138.1 Iron deficiency-induced protein A precursor [Corynebacterium ciconiae DSM 44920]